MSEWKGWEGRLETSRDDLCDKLVRRWLATLDVAAPEDGNVPQAIHWCLCLPDTPTSRLGSDGHPVRDNGHAGFLPPVPLPRRMWAASNITFERPLRLGQAILRKSRIASITEKQGSSGRLLFVDVDHETLADGIFAIRETQSIVYRESAPGVGSALPAPTDERHFNPSEWDAHRVIMPSSQLLFRFSALTFNSHRIHYDLPYAINEEGYYGLVVHGPLTATLLLDLAQRQFGVNKVSYFEFRASSPAIANEDLHLVLRDKGDGIILGAFAADGRQVMAANAQIAASS